MRIFVFAWPIYASLCVCSCATLRSSPYDATGVVFDKMDAKFQERHLENYPELVLNLRQDRNYNEFRKTIRIPTRMVGVVTVREDIRHTYDFLLRKAVAEGRIHGCDFVVEYARCPDLWTSKNRNLTHDYLDWQFTCEVPLAQGEVSPEPPKTPERHCSRTTDYGELCFETTYPYSPL